MSVLDGMAFWFGKFLVDLGIFFGILLIYFIFVLWLSRR